MEEKKKKKKEKRYEPPQIKSLAASKAFGRKCQTGDSASPWCQTGNWAGNCGAGNTMG